MSRACHRATCSRAETQYPRSSRARPEMFSLPMGVFLCGMADEPFCPLPKGSMASRTSVRWRCRISVAIFSRLAPMTASVAKNSA